VTSPLSASTAGERTLTISGTVFVYACLVLVLVALVVAAGGLVMGLSAAAGEREVSALLIETRAQLAERERALIRSEARVGAFEDLLLRTQHTAVEASLKAFEREYGKPVQQATLMEYDTWLRRK
jgi:hypothetical protein